MSNAIAIILHLLAINVWIGGTFFSVMVLPRALTALTPAEKHRLSLHILHHYFIWVWLAIVLVIASGGWMATHVFGSFQHLPTYVIVMISIAVTMMVVFMFMFFGPYRHYRRAEQAEDLTACEHYLGQVRLLSKINMFLGIGVLVAIGTGLYLMA